MSNDKKLGIIGFLLACFAVLLIYFYATSDGRRAINLRNEAFAIADNETKYETKKLVEDAARSMIVSYESDKLYWEQYKDSDNAKEKEWAGQAKFRANKTAVSYNEYVLKNSRVWDGNIPKDIMEKLPIL